jgi:ribonucleoside-diphosphate reductase beta chain
MATDVEVKPVGERFLLTPDLMAGGIYRKYEKATRKFWDPKELDYERDRADWLGLTEEQRGGLVTITVRIEAGEEAVTDELLPMLAAAHALGRFDWVMFLSTFMLDEARHSEFFTIWHREVCDLHTPAEKAAHWPLREHTQDPSGRFRTGEPVYEGIPRYGNALMEAVHAGERRAIEEGFVRFATLYNTWVEGVLTMPTYEIVLDTCAMWGGVLPTLCQGFRGILADEGRHITFGTEACALLIRELPEYEALVHEVVDEYCGNAVGMLEYQRNVPGLDLQKYQTQKVRHYRNRCRELGIAPDEPLIEAILDPSVDFVVGVQAG